MEAVHREVAMVQITRSRLAAVLLVAGVARSAPAPETPIESGETERVEVRLVTLDVTVLDSKDQAVPGLLRSDFELEVDGKPVEIATFDADCAEHPGGAGPEVEDLSAPSEPAGARRIVLALDYLHMRWEP